MADLNIIGLPKNGFNYEFIVVTPSIVENEFLCRGCFKNGFDAEECCKHFQEPLVIHNVRIQGYRKPKKYYSFTGVWSWGCWAESQEEAERLFAESDIEDFEFIDGYDNVEIIDD